MCGYFKSIQFIRIFANPYGNDKGSLILTPDMNTEIIPPNLLKSKRISSSNSWWKIAAFPKYFVKKQKTSIR